MINEKGNQVGIVPLSEAIEKAESIGTDLVEIGPNANPPVCKLIDFKKFKYFEQKKEREARKHAKDVEIKEIRFGPFVSDHDLKTRLDRATEFFSKGNRVKITVRFTGRQMAHPEFGPSLLNRVIEYFADKVKIEREIKFEGRQCSVTLSPTR